MNSFLALKILIIESSNGIAVLTLVRRDIHVAERILEI
jgi:hypothetical protein